MGNKPGCGGQSWLCLVILQVSSPNSDRKRTGCHTASIPEFGGETIGPLLLPLGCRKLGAVKGIILVRPN
jgi:hypothetical protein